MRLKQFGRLLNFKRSCVAATQTHRYAFPFAILLRQRLFCWRRAGLTFLLSCHLDWRGKSTGDFQPSILSLRRPADTDTLTKHVTAATLSLPFISMPPSAFVPRCAFMHQYKGLVQKEVCRGEGRNASTSAVQLGDFQI